MEIVEKVILPIVLGITSYLLTAKMDTWKERRKYSKLGIATFRSLKEEIDNGIKIMSENQKGQVMGYSLPRASWYGMTTIPDEVLLILFELNKTDYPDLFPINEIKIHCKNYFEHMTTTWDTIAIRENGWETLHAKIISDFLEASNKLIKTIDNIIVKLDENSKSIFPK